MNKIPCGGFHISGGNFVEMDGQKILTPLGGGVIDYPIHYEGSVVGIGSGDGQDSAVFDDGIQIPFPLIVGRKYHVVINGVGQDLECYDNDGEITIGYPWEAFEDAKINMWQIYESDDVDEEGVIQHWITFVYVGRLNQVYNFSLDGVVEEVKKIDEKFLPESGGGGDVYIAIVGDFDGRRVIVKGTFAEIKRCVNTGTPFIILRNTDYKWNIAEIDYINDTEIVYDNYEYAWNSDDTINFIG